MAKSNKAKWVFNTDPSNPQVNRRVTVYADTQEEASLKARGILDRRCEKAGIEPPVGWTLFLDVYIKTVVLDIPAHSSNGPKQYRILEADAKVLYNNGCLNRANNHYSFNNNHRWWTGEVMALLQSFARVSDENYKTNQNLSPHS